MKKAILYVRVSTDEQADRGYSLRDQEERLKSYCDIHKIDVAAIYQEDHSAKNFNRPEFKKLLVFAKANKQKIDLLLFIKWDRFSRNATESYQVLKKFDELSIDVQAIEQPFQDDVPENKIMKGLYLIVPEVENDRRSMNTVNGIRRAKKEGRWVCGAPKGYSNKRDENNKPIIVPNEDANFIEQAFEEIAKGIRPYDHIRRELNKQGFKCSKSNFATLIRNPVYMGKIWLGSYKEEPEMIVDGLHEPIVDETIFYKVQDILDGRRKRINRPKINRIRTELPLRGFIYCTKCGNILTGSGSKGNGGRYFYYHCNKCRQERIRANEINDSILDILKSFKITSEYKTLFIQIFKDMVSKNQRDNSRSRSENQSKIKKLEDRLINLEDKFADGEISTTDFHKIKSRYEGQIIEIGTKNVEITLERKELDQMIQKAANLMERLDSVYTQANVEDKQKLVGSIFKGKMFFEENKVRTTDINEVVKLICNNNKEFQRAKKRLVIDNLHQSGQVAGAGFEPTTFGL